MTSPDRSNVPPTKRRKLNDTPVGEADGTGATFTGLSRPVSPPISRRKPPMPAAAPLLAPAPTWSFDEVPQQIFTPTPSQPPPQPKTANQDAANSIETAEQKKSHEAVKAQVRCLASPFQLTKIRDLAPHQNVDTVELKDILGNPMIKECWNFNFLFDLDFVM